jgi:hypothetical protein
MQRAWTAVMRALRHKGLACCQAWAMRVQQAPDSGITGCHLVSIMAVGAWTDQQCMLLFCCHEHA